MSWPALAWASKCHVGSASEKLMLLAYADRHNEETGCAYPSIEWLTSFSCLNRKTVIASIAKLEASGLLSDTGERMGRTKQIKVYRVHTETVPKAEQSQKRNSSDISPKESQKRDTEPSREPVSPTVATQPTEKRARVQFLPPPGVDAQVWGDFLASPNRRKAGMSQTAYSGICNNLRKLAEHGFPPGEMIAMAVERGWKTVKLEWVQNDGRSGNGMAGNRRDRPDDGLSSTARAALKVFGGGHPHISQ